METLESRRRIRNTRTTTIPGTLKPSLASHRRRLPKTTETLATGSDVAPMPSRSRLETLGPYRVGAKIASGGMAEVFLAYPTQGPKRQLVIKAMHSHLAGDSLYRSMFVREARLCSRLEHPNIVSLIDFFATEDGLFLVFEFIDGLDIRRVLKTCAGRGVQVPPELAAYIVAHLLEALDYAHTLRIGGADSGIVHRDLSPSNVLLSWRGQVKLADFGVAQIVEDAPSREKSLLTGKFGYMSPEQVRGEQLDGRSDLFSAGVVLAELLMCRRLFREQSTADLLVAVDHVKLDRLEAAASAVPDSLLDIVRRALLRDRNDRFASAAEFRDALTHWLSTRRNRTGSHVLAAFLTKLRPILVPD